MTVYLVNGFQLRGVVKGYDPFTVMLEYERKTHLVYKHAISTISPGPPPFRRRGRKKRTPSEFAHRADEDARRAQRFRRRRRANAGDWRRCGRRTANLRSARRRRCGRIDHHRIVAVGRLLDAHDQRGRQRSRNVRQRRALRGALARRGRRRRSHRFRNRRRNGANRNRRARACVPGARDDAVAAHRRAFRRRTRRRRHRRRRESARRDLRLPRATESTSRRARAAAADRSAVCQAASTCTWPSCRTSIACAYGIGSGEPARRRRVATGATAAVAAAVDRGTASSPVEVVVPGGVLAVEWDGREAVLIGPAVRVFDTVFTVRDL